VLGQPGDDRPEPEPRRVSCRLATDIVGVTLHFGCQASVSLADRLNPSEHGIGVRLQARAAEIEQHPVEREIARLCQLAAEVTGASIDEGDARFPRIRRRNDG
jgi:hypothetical protein